MKKFFYLIKVKTVAGNIFKIGRTDDIHKRQAQLKSKYGARKIKFVAIYKNDYVISPKDIQKNPKLGLWTQDKETYVKMLIKHDTDGLGNIKLLSSEEFMYLGYKGNKRKDVTNVKRWLDKELGFKKDKVEF